MSPRHKYENVRNKRREEEGVDKELDCCWFLMVGPALQAAGPPRNWTGLMMAVWRPSNQAPTLFSGWTANLGSRTVGM